MGARAALAVAVAVMAGAACSTPVDPGRSGGSPSRSGASPSSGLAEGPGASGSSTGPGRDGQPSGAQTADGGPSRPYRQPVALVTHASRPAFDLTTPLARAVLAGEVRRWRRIGAGTGRLRLVAAPHTPAPARFATSSSRAVLATVTANRDVLGVLPAAAVRPSVRTVTVGRRDPLRRPRAYPVTMSARHRPGPVTTITAVGDLMLGRSVGAQLMATGDFGRPLRPTAARLSRADLTVGNLESTLSRAGSPRQGDDSFAAPVRALRGLRRAGFDVLSLANNHTGDFGPLALVRTVRRVRAGGFQPVGAGAHLESARRPVVVSPDGVRVGVLAFNAIAETPRAGPERPGVVSVRMAPRTGPLDPGDLDRMRAVVRRLAGRVDIVLVLPHWGEQYTAVPVPDQRRVARALVAAGADAVLGSHPHWVQGFQRIGDGFVAYSLGNFVFDMDFSRPTREGVFVELTFWGDRLLGARPVPVLIDAEYAPRVVRGPAAAAILARLRSTSGPAFRP